MPNLLFGVLELAAKRQNRAAECIHLVYEAVGEGVTEPCTKDFAADRVHAHLACSDRIIEHRSQFFETLERLDLPGKIVCKLCFLLSEVSTIGKHVEPALEFSAIHRPQAAFRLAQVSPTLHHRSA